MVTSCDLFGAASSMNVSKRIGKVYDLEKFDAFFFSVHNQQTNVMDPQTRILVEVAYEALLDSGNNPKNLRGSRIGVFMSASYSDTETNIYNDVTNNKYHMTG